MVVEEKKQEKRVERKANQKRKNTPKKDSNI